MESLIIILEWPWLGLLTIRVVENGAILGQPDAFETKPIEISS